MPFKSQAQRLPRRTAWSAARSPPGFEFADFELAEVPELEARYPAAANLIARMRRPRD
jgi:hypothetical protein